MRALLSGLILAAMPVGAQWKLPDNLPLLPEDGSSCNDTHCLVNRDDWMAMHLAMQIAGEELANRAEAIRQLSHALEEEQSRRTLCAEVKKIPVPIPGLKRTGSR